MNHGAGDERDEVAAFAMTVKIVSGLERGVRWSLTLDPRDGLKNVVRRQINVVVMDSRHQWINGARTCQSLTISAELLKQAQSRVRSWTSKYRL